MNKMLVAALVGVFCLGATNVFAQTQTQTKPETDQEKIIRLEVENAALRAQLVSLTQNQAQPASTQVQGNAAQAELKPYYETLQIQQLCEAFDRMEGYGADRDDKIDQYAKEQYARHGRKVVKVETNSYSITTGVFSGSKPRRVYQITITILNAKRNRGFEKTYQKWVPENRN